MVGGQIQLFLGHWSIGVLNIMCFELRVPRCGLRVTGCGLRVEGKKGKGPREDFGKRNAEVGMGA